MAEAAPGLAGDSAGRVIKQFDFHERPSGNFEDVPMLWERHVAEGFPEYATGRFDAEVGCTSPPSFYLDLNGRSCAYVYTGSDIPVSGSSGYRVLGHVRPHELRYARAYLSAFYNDASGKRIPGTETFSRLVGGDTSDKQWEELSVLLAADVPGAFYIGITLWVTQSSVWWTGARPFKYIEWKDVHGGAWFDDLAVLRLPSIALTSSAARQGHVYAADETPELVVNLGEDTTADLRAGLEIRTAAGQTVRRERLDSANDQDPPIRRIPLPELAPGLYRARLTMQITGGTTIDRSLTFARLAGPTRDPAPALNRYGIALAPEEHPDWDAQAALFEMAGVRYGKAPMVGQLDGSTEADPGRLAFVKRQFDAGVTLTGVFAMAPQVRDSATSSLIDLLSLDPQSWQPAVAGLVTRYDNLLREWQVGLDGAPEVIGDARLPAVLGSLSAEMSRLTVMPVLTAPWTLHNQLAPGELPSDYLSVSVPADVLPEEIPGAFQNAFDQLDRDQIWAVLEMPAADHYHRLAYLADFAKRLIYTHQSPARRIFVPQPWHTHNSPGQPTTEIDEEFLVYRTMVAHLDASKFMGPLHLADSITCFAFDRDGHCVLAAWDDEAPPGGREYTLYLNGADHSTDLWGNQTELKEIGHDHRIRLSQVPVLIHDAETWLVEFQQGLRFDPPFLPSESTSHELNMRLLNPRPEPVSGNLKFSLPKGWQMRPSQLHFALQPHEESSQSLRIQAAPCEPAGLKHIGTQVTLDATRLHHFEVDLPLELNLADMEVWADLALEGSNLVVRHGVTNRSNETVTFRSFADAPGRKRRNLNIINLAPNQTALKGHLFTDAGALSGKEIHVGLRQVRGPRVHHLVVTVP